MPRRGPYHHRLTGLILSLALLAATAAPAAGDCGGGCRGQGPASTGPILQAAPCCCCQGHAEWRSCLDGLGPIPPAITLTNPSGRAQALDLVAWSGAEAEPSRPTLRGPPGDPRLTAAPPALFLRHAALRR